MNRVTFPKGEYKEIEQNGRVFFARFDAVEADGMVECTEMGVMVEGNPTYPKLVAALITGRYDYDTQIAMLANHEDGDETHEADFEAFQEWRTEAKRLARIVFPK